MPTITKPCPDCGGRLLVRRNKATRTIFLGCENWPECTFTEGIPTDVVMRARGAPELPGFGGGK